MCCCLAAVYWNLTLLAITLFTGSSNNASTILFQVKTDFCARTRPIPRYREVTGSAGHHHGTVASEPDRWHRSLSQGTGFVTRHCPPKQGQSQRRRVLEIMAVVRQATSQTRWPNQCYPSPPVTQGPPYRGYRGASNGRRAPNNTGRKVGRPSNAPTSELARRRLWACWQWCVVGLGRTSDGAGRIGCTNRSGRFVLEFLWACWQWCVVGLGRTSDGAGQIRCTNRSGRFVLEFRRGCCRRWACSGSLP